MKRLEGCGDGGEAGEFLRRVHGRPAVRTDIRGGFLMARLTLSVKDVTTPSNYGRDMLIDYLAANAALKRVLDVLECFVGKL